MEKLILTFDRDKVTINCYTGNKTYVQGKQSFLFQKIISLVRQPIFVHDRQLAIDLTPVPDWHAPFLRGFKCGQIQGFQQRLSTWENAPLPVQFAVGSIETLNRVSRIDDRPDVGRKLKDWCDDVPVPFPPFHGVRVFL